jgi:hypothetical protein
LSARARSSGRGSMMCRHGSSRGNAVPVDRFHETNWIGRMELKPADLILRRREAPSRRMGVGSVLACGRPSRRAQKRAPQDEVTPI